MIIDQFLPLDGPGQCEGEVVQAEHLAEVGPAGRTDGPQRVTAALQLGQRDVLPAVRLQELQGTLGNTGHRDQTTNTVLCTYIHIICALLFNLTAVCILSDAMRALS